MASVSILPILGVALIASASPGPATLAIAETSMASGRASGLSVASGITLGSLIWSVAAALGLSAVMLANAWLFEIVRLFGVAYLIWLAFKSAKSAVLAKTVPAKPMSGNRARQFMKGLALHLTNPKAILFFGAIYSLGIPADISPSQLSQIVLAIGLQSFLIFHGYALLFSIPVATRCYVRLRRWFEALFAVAFGIAGLKILTARLY